MRQFIQQFLAQARWADLLDIIVICVVLYFGLLWLRQRASRSVVAGIAIIGIVYVLANRIGMYLTSWFFQAGLTALIVALVLVFQEDIRRLFEHVASWGLAYKKRLMSASASIDALLESIRSMAHDRIGALVIIKGKESLERHIRGGNSLSGRISIPLILSIFHPESPGHDGAVIIEGDRIDRFGVYLPLSTNLAEVGEGGTRHTAGLGISERTDALVIIVSEERGTISIAQEGKLDHVPSAEALKERVESFYRTIFPTPAQAGKTAWFTKNLRLKSLSLVTAIALWALFAYRVAIVNRTYVVPIEYRNIPQNWVIADPKPTDARISLSGSERAFNFDPAGLVISLDMNAIRDGTQDIVITDKSINVPSRVSISMISPKKISVRAYQMVEIMLPVKAQFVGQLPDTLAVGSVEYQPPYVAVLVPKGRSGRDAEVRTESINLSDFRQTGAVRCNIIPPESGQLSDRAPQSVRVTITIARKS
jgi:uncharacterized protein (TIGR00159 family)